MQYFKNFGTIDYDINGDGKTRKITDVFRKIKVDPQFLDDITFYTFYSIRNGERPDNVSYKLYGKIDYHWTFVLLNPWLLDIRKDWPMNNLELEDYVFEEYSKDVLMINSIELATKYRVGESIQGLASDARGIITKKDPNLGYIVITKTNTKSFSNGELVLGTTTNDYLTIQGERKEYNAPHHYELNNRTVDRFTNGALPITNYEYEIARNEANTRIKVIRPELIQAITEKFIQAIS